MQLGERAGTFAQFGDFTRDDQRWAEFDLHRVAQVFRRHEQERLSVHFALAERLADKLVGQPADELSHLRDRPSARICRKAVVRRKRHRWIGRRWSVDNRWLLGDDRWLLQVRLLAVGGFGRLRWFCGTSFGAELLLLVEEALGEVDFLADDASQLIGAEIAVIVVEAVVFLLSTAGMIGIFGDVVGVVGGKRLAALANDETADVVHDHVVALGQL